MPHPRLIEARSIITHGLSEAGATHEEYMQDFQKMVAQVERLYGLWLIDTGRAKASPESVREPEAVEA